MKSNFVRTILRIALFAFLAVTAFGQKVMIEHSREIDFSGFRKYEWKEHPFLKNNPESRQYTVGADLVQNSVNQILMARGYEPVDGSPAEFYITQFITARAKQETHSVPTATVPNYYMWPGSWYAWSGAYFTVWDTYVDNYAEGILLLDVVDAKTNTLLWRAACKAKIDDMSERHKVVEDVVKKALKSFPPKFKQP